MTRRDMIWRGAAALVMLGSGVAAQMEVGGTNAAVGFFLLSLAAIIVMVNGHHVLTAIRAERRGHALTAEAVHAARVRRRAARGDR